jgi:Large polyvalent protein associated domain 22
MNDMANTALDPVKGVFDPLNTTFDLSEEGIDRVVAQSRSADAIEINRGLEANPDDAAESMQLSDITGLPAPHVLNNFDDVRDQVRRQTAQQLVLNNPELVAYLQSHPMAASVSNDDWGNLDKYTHDAQTSVVMFNSLKNAFNKIGEEELTGLQEGWNSADLSQEYQKYTDPSLTGPVGAAAAKLGYGAINVLFKTLGAGMGLAGGAAKGIGEAIGGESLGREAQAMTEWELQRGDQPFHTGESGVASVKPPPEVEAGLRAAPWVDAGMEPPAGVHPLLDQAKLEINTRMIEAMEQAFASAQASLTKERSPESFERVSPSLRDVTFDITGDAALGLYGDKPPTADDGLLGWVPGIDAQLAAARDVGTSITVKMSDWMVHADPAVAKALRDDLRMWPGGITANEAKEPIPPKEVVDAPIAEVRSAAGLEPKFSMGDRKLTLQKGTTEDNQWTQIFQGKLETLDMLDENGKSVGQLEVVPGENRELYVNMISGQAGLWSNSFGPALMMDLKRQLKAMYPEYDTLSGHRVSGARERAGFGGDLARVKLDADGPISLTDHRKMQDIFTRGWDTEAGMRVNVPMDRTFYTEHELAIDQATSNEIAKLTGGKAISEGVAEIQANNQLGVRGAYVPRLSRPPKILYDLLGPDAVGVGRHESIHFLKDYKLFTSEEWSTLEAAAHSEGWLDRYHINDRYKDLDPASRTEEAIAEGFREWAGQGEGVRPQTGIGAIFQKIWDFLDHIRKGLGQYLNGTPEWEEIFHRTSSGEVGQRPAGEPRHPRQYRFSIEGDDNLRAQSVGLPLNSFRKLQEGWRAQHEADIKAAQARAERDQARRQTAEWRSNRADMAKEISAEISQRPDIMADAFIGSGELGGKKLQQRFTLRADDLTPEQRAALPDHYTSTHGLPADQVAGMFGYGSKDELVDALGRVNIMRQAATGDRIAKGDFMRRLVQAETDRRMELRYGKLDDNIMSEAQDQALSTSSLNVMHEELMAQALRGGVTTFGKDVMQAAAERMIDETPIGQVSSYKLMQLMGKHGRDTQKALLAEDHAGAAIAMQKQTVTAYVAKEARAVEQEVKQFDRTAKTLAKRERPSMEPEYTNWIHQILSQIGKPIRRTPEDLAHEIAATKTTNLADFVDEKTSYGQIMPVWEQLFDKTWTKPYKDLLVPEFRAVRDSVKTIAKNGRDERKLINAGNEADADEIKSQLVSNLQQFPERQFDVEGEVTAKGKPAQAGILRHTWARLLTVETILNRWDNFDWKGPWQQSFFRPLSEGANQLAAWEKEMGATIKSVVNRPAVTDSVSNTLFRDPINGKFRPMTRENLRTVMLNMGNDSNIEKLTRGWSLPKFDHKITFDMVKAWVDQHATKDDWDFVQGIWNALKKPRDWSGTMYRSMSEVPLQGIEARAIDTPHGRYEGGYYPIQFSKAFEGSSAKLSGISLDGLFGSGYSTGFAPDATYKIERTDYQAPLAMTMDALPGAIRQQLRDAALRPALANASKILRDPGVRDAIKERYGSEYHDMLKEYLRRLAGTENRGGPQGQYTWLASRTLEMARQNLISTLVGFNPGTVMKHGATAFVLSAKEVGPVNMLRAMRQLYTINDETGQTWRQFAYESSQELQRRSRNWRENLYGSTVSEDSKGWFGQTREQFIRWGSKPVAMADALSSEPTWLAAYMKERDEGGSHGDGVAAGDRAVRRAHGSTSDAAQPMIMSHLSPWVSSLYNFFNDVLNRAVETVWRAGDMLGSRGRPKDWSLAPGVVAGMFATAIWPAIVENLVSPLPNETGESTTKRVLKGSVHSIAAMFPVIRDFAEYVMGGDSPDVGLLTTEFKALGGVLKDFEKKAPFNDAHAEKLIRDFGLAAGAVTGAPGLMIGREAGFGYGLASGHEHPHGAADWLVGARYGTVRKQGR